VCGGPLTMRLWCASCEAVVDEPDGDGPDGDENVSL
jgi:hypothetical protein